MKKYENRIVIVTRATRLEKVLAAQNTVSQARFYVKQLGGDFDEYEQEHLQYGSSVQNVKRDLDGLAGIQILDRQYLPNFVFAPDDIIVVVGQDGLVANTIKYLDDQPVIGINPDTSRWDGVLLPFLPGDAVKIVTETIEGKRKTEAVTMAKAKVQNGQELLAVNDFFIGQKGHASARYILKYGGYREPQSSSGIIVSTGLGSTGWMKSIIAGSSRISASVIGHPFGFDHDSERFVEEDAEISKQAEEESMAMDFMDVSEIQADMAPPEPMMEQAARAASAPRPMGTLKKASSFFEKKKKTYGISELSKVVGKWASEELVFAVREPFPSKTTGATLVFGTVSPGDTLRVESLMGENGVIFSDGIETDYISFNSGTEVLITKADKQGRMVV
ncbi:NAD(+)/NADH kinase [Breznakiella homolactica]|uniref:NAD(+)/NADH kinase n=1 Tax=Breznakiella homolactica TaxID=2798577 RepID=A0A7T7XMA3_9SPIR|nr:NAD(+)/NADH kinase [Breznakiella homolactica]QQO08979.1 NAD(+)/NADH kinase [Breznakiella homolactica]